MSQLLMLLQKELETNHGVSKLIRCNKKLIKNSQATKFID